MTNRQAMPSAQMAKNRARSRGQLITWPRLLAFACLCYALSAASAYLGTGSVAEVSMPSWADSGAVVRDPAAIADTTSFLTDRFPWAEQVPNLLESTPLRTKESVWRYLGVDHALVFEGEEGEKDLFTLVLITKNSSTIVVRLNWLFKAIFPGTNKIYLPDGTFGRKVSAEYSDVSVETTESGLTFVAGTDHKVLAYVFPINSGIMLTNDFDILKRHWSPAEGYGFGPGMYRLRLDGTTPNNYRWLQSAILSPSPAIVSRNSDPGTSTILNGLIYIGGSEAVK